MAQVGRTEEARPVYKLEGWTKFRQTPQIKMCDMVLELETEARDIIVMALDKFIANKGREGGISAAAGRKVWAQKTQ